MKKKINKFFNSILEKVYEKLENHLYGVNSFELLEKKDDEINHLENEVDRLTDQVEYWKEKSYERKWA